MSLRLHGALASLLAIFLWSGCTGETDTSTHGYTLEIVGDRSVVTYEYDVKPITVRYKDGLGNPVIGIVDFAIDGPAAGALLSKKEVETDRLGLATVQLTAGNTTKFEVVATAPMVRSAAIVKFDIQPMPKANLEYTVTYTGFRDLMSAEVALYDHFTCTEVYEQRPAPWTAQMAPIGVRKFFADVPAGHPIAVLALALDRDYEIGAAVCVDVVVRQPRQFVHLELADVDEVEYGTYTSESRVDVTNGTLAALDDTMRRVRELLRDPAAVAVDRVAEDPNTAYWVRRAIYPWWIRREVAETLRRAIRAAHGQSYLDRLAVAADEMDYALDHVAFFGRLTLREPDTAGATSGHHRIDTFAMPIGNRTVHRMVARTANIFATDGARLFVYEHDYPVVLGEVVDTAMAESLAAVPGEPSTISALVMQTFDYDKMDKVLPDCRSERHADVARCVVERAVELDWSDYGTDALWRYTTLHLQIATDLVDTNGDYVRDGFDHGVMTLRWTDLDQGEPLRAVGTFDGTLIEQRSAPLADLRERIEAMFF